MVIFSTLDSVEATPEGRVVAIGVFDGVHIGHQSIIGQAVAAATECSARATAVTFHPHPEAVLRRRSAPRALTPPERKAQLLGALGVEEVVTVEFDREFARFESSQSFNLVDAGAFFFAGPIGLAVTKGYNFASIFRGAGGSSSIEELFSDWKVERGIAQAKDVAMATDENRVALTGSINFVNERFDDVTVALVDARGCARVKQKIHGPLQKPVVEKPSVLMSLAGPALNLLKQAGNLFTDGTCEVFYRGSVPAPK